MAGGGHRKRPSTFSAFHKRNTSSSSGGGARTSGKRITKSSSLSPTRGGSLSPSKDKNSKIDWQSGDSGTDTFVTAGKRLPITDRPRSLSKSPSKSPLSQPKHLMFLPSLQ